MTSYDAVIESPVGHLGLIFEENQLVGIEFLPTDFSLFVSDNAFIKEAASQLICYFNNPHIVFTFPWRLKGTLFQQQVWSRLQQIPVGKKETYGSLAKELNTAPRAIGQACRKNPLPIIIPCHRVTAQKSLGGFFGQTQGAPLLRKEWLLRHENIR